MDRHSMRRFPPLPDLDDEEAPDDVLEGHLWLLELIDGSGLRFRMDDSGLLRFGGPEATYADLDAVPLALRSAVRCVRDRFDREALRSAVDDPAGVTFFGVATHRRGTDYDWDRLPSFLGTDVWVGGGGEADAGTTDGAFRPPDSVAAIFDGVGLDPVNAVAREVNARDFDPDRYAVPASAWRDGPAAGVVVRNKRGGRGRIVRGVVDGAMRATTVTPTGRRAATRPTAGPVTRSPPTSSRRHTPDGSGSNGSSRASNGAAIRRRSTRSQTGRSRRSHGRPRFGSGPNTPGRPGSMSPASARPSSSARGRSSTTVEREITAVRAGRSNDRADGE